MCRAAEAQERRAEQAPLPGQMDQGARAERADEADRRAKEGPPGLGGVRPAARAEGRDFMEVLTENVLPARPRPQSPASRLVISESDPCNGICTF